MRCIVCHEQATPGAPLFRLVCECTETHSAPLVHARCAEQESRVCDKCGKSFARSATNLYWQHVLLGSVAGFLEPLIVFLVLLALSYLRGVRLAPEEIQEIVADLQFWVTPILAFPIWAMQRVILGRTRWLKPAKPWSCCAVRTIVGLVFVNARCDARPGPVDPTAIGARVSWARLPAAVLCDLFIALAVVWANYYLAPIQRVYLAPLWVACIAFLYSMIYAKLFRKRLLILKLVASDQVPSESA